MKAPRHLRWGPVTSLPERYRDGLIHPATGAALTRVIAFETSQRAQPVFAHERVVMVGNVMVPVGEPRLVGAVPLPAETTGTFETEAGDSACGFWTEDGGWFWKSWEITR